MKIKYTVLGFLILVLSSCNGGLSPVYEKSYLTGKINYIKGPNKWPSKDSVFGIRLAAFKKMPDKNIIAEVLAGNAYFTSESFPMFVDSSSFKLEITQTPVNLVYIVAVQQYDSLIFSQKPIGIYTISGDKLKPSSIFVETGKSYNINIDVDFDNLPPMPF